jgi:hypothetical protein
MFNIFNYVCIFETYNRIFICLIIDQYQYSHESFNCQHTKQWDLRISLFNNWLR